MERCCLSPPFTLKSLNAAAGDNPFLCLDLLLIQSNSRVESCANTNIWWNMISSRGEERVWRKRIKSARGEMFFFFFWRTCVTVQRECVSALLAGGTLTITYISGADNKHTRVEKWPDCCSDVEGVSGRRSRGHLKRRSHLIDYVP